MSLIVANTSFAFGKTVFTRGQTYDTANANNDIAAANTAVPHLFYATGGTKTAQGTFLYRSTMAGGIDRIVGNGEVLPSGDNAVSQKGSCFK